MAKLVLGIGTSHTPMLNAPAEDWPRFIDRDGVRDFLDNSVVPYQMAEPSAELKTAQIASNARAYTMLVSCSAKEDVNTDK